jgi:DNA repair protein RecN (Recombination protein N)
MLRELRVRDLGVIEDLTIVLDSGMTALTGETGAGKTLLVEALQLVLGGRGVSGLVRAGADEALVEARFEPSATDRIGSPDTEIVLTRSIGATGRSRAWIDGRMSPLARLAELGGPLVDIHGQRDQQSLRSSASQRLALDQVAGSNLGPLRTARQRRREIDEALTALGGDERDRARQVDLLKHQLTEIDRAQIADADEEERLAAQEDLLADLAAHQQAAADSLAALVGDGDEGAVDLVGRAVAALGDRRSFSEIDQRLRGLQAELSDAASELRDRLDGLDDDPAQLAEVQARRRSLGELRRKYGATLADVLEFRTTAADQLAGLLGADEQAARLAEDRSAVDRRVGDAEAELRRVRIRAARQLAPAVERRIRGLDLPGAKFSISLTDQGTGEPVQFLFGANPGEPTQPLADVGSGGELARATLALRLETSGGPPSIVFDEVDAGVGGAAAIALAAALREAAQTHQVLVVTHLAQVAAMADHHVLLRKRTTGGRTVTSAHPLDGEGRVGELSRMLSGLPDSATARAHAQELLTRAGADGSSAVHHRRAERRLA